MSLYDLSKDMLVQLIQNMNNYEKLDKSELKEKRKYIDSILIKQKGELLDKNIEHKKIIEKHKDYFLSVDVSFCDYEYDDDVYAVLSSLEGTIIAYFCEDGICIDPNYSDCIDNQKLRTISEDLQTTKNLISLLEFLEEIQ